MVKLKIFNTYALVGNKVMVNIAVEKSCATMSFEFKFFRFGWVK